MPTFLAILAVLATLVLVYLFIFRPWYLRWGATPAETALALPGDELVTPVKLQSTRAISIHAPAEKVWQWLVQLGRGRGGMYSYEWLENLAGCDIHNVYQVRPELQHLQPGDVVSFGPKGYPQPPVTMVEAGRLLLLGDAVGGTMGWYLFPQPDGTTRLVARQRNTYNNTVGSIMWHIIEPISFIMEQKMLHTLRDLAEGSHPGLKTA